MSVFRGVIPAACLIFLAAFAAAEPDWIPARRRAQFSTEPGYAVVPYLFDLPGIGKGYGVLGALTNVGHTCADLAGTFFTGDVNGQALSVDSVHLVPQRLILDMGGARLSRATVRSYRLRGMGSGKDDYSLAEFSDAMFGGSRLTATFEDRRYEAFAGLYGASLRLQALRERDGTLIVDASGSPRQHFQVEIVGGRIDLTDDYQDPRRGVRFEPSFWRSPPSGSGPDFYLADYSLTGYLPIGRRSTWAFNWLRSDAHVLRKGETNLNVLADRTGLNCASISDPADHARCDQYLDQAAAANRHGTASSLGGVRRLRSFPENRFQGAHSEFLGTELRWNLTDTVKPFDILIMKDIRTAVQIAFFYELGSVADTRGELWTRTRASYGTGLRIVTASGLIYRLDFATGAEGPQPSIFFQYPWEL